MQKWQQRLTDQYYARLRELAHLEDLADGKSGVEEEGATPSTFEYIPFASQRPEFFLPSGRSKPQTGVTMKIVRH